MVDAVVVDVLVVGRGRGRRDVVVVVVGASWSGRRGTVVVVVVSQLGERRWWSSSFGFEVVVEPSGFDVVVSAHGPKS